MTRIRYTMPVRSQGKLHMQGGVAELVGEDVHRWVFVYSMDSDVEALVCKWLVQRLDNFYCDLQVMYIPRFTGPTRVRTHVVLNNAPPLHAVARTDEVVEVDARDLNPRDAAKAIVKATGLSPHLSVRGWPFCLNDVGDVDDVDDVDDAEGV